MYHSLQEELHIALDSAISLHDAVISGYHFIPTEKHILRQLRNWPPSIPFIMPPASWVSPRQGMVSYKGELWNYAFHGAGLSFFGKKTGVDIGVAYCREGQICVTHYDIWRYQQTSVDKIASVYDSEDHHLNLFNELVSLGYLVEKDPLLAGDDRTYILGK